MTNAKAQESFEKLLTSILARSIDFVKFAEAKNAALLTFASAWILASITLLYGNSPLSSNDFRVAFAVALLLFFIGALGALWSFLPQTSLSEFHKDPERGKALLYFGDAAEFSPESYRDRLRTRYFPPKDAAVTESYLDDISVQINVNSRIALRKFRLFKFGAMLVLLGLVALSIPPTLHFADLVSISLKAIQTRP